jgi:hypothetical protein
LYPRIAAPPMHRIEHCTLLVGITMEEEERWVLVLVLVLVLELVLAV